MGFTFERWWLLFLLVIPLLLGVWECTRRGNPLVLPFDHARPGRKPVLWWTVTIANLLPLVLLAVAIAVLAGPRKLRSAQSERKLTNIQFCLDVSGSMTAQFGSAGSRYDGAMQAITDFTTYRPGDAFGLTIFGTEVLHWVPTTKDLSALRMATPFLRPERMPPYFGGTRIGKALREAQKVLVARPEGDRMIILVSDGDSADLGGGAAQEIAQELRRDKIVVYFIKVSNEAANDEVQAITSTTGGQSFEAGDPQALKEVFQRIDQMQAAQMKPGGSEYADYFTPVAIAGLAAGLLHLLTLFGLRYTPW